MNRMINKSGINLSSYRIWGLASLGFKVFCCLSPLTFIIFILRDNPSAEVKVIAFASLPFFFLSYSVFYVIKRLPKSP